MPELPEVETTLNGIRPYLQGLKIARLEVRQRNLRWPIADNLERKVSGVDVVEMQRRGKYILIHFDRGGLIVHLGMSGSMRVLLNDELPGKHDHFDIINQHGQIIRYRDPRRFGCLLYTSDSLLQHPRLINLGIEPLSNAFTGHGLYQLSRKRTTPIKSFVMDGRIVVGVGNIYVCEALFLAGISPIRQSGKISLARYQVLAGAIRTTLKQALRQGGTTLQDFVGADGAPGYFTQSLSVYGREGDQCLKCSTGIKRKVISQRSTFYCPKCQT